MTTSLFEHTRKHVEKAMLDVTGDDDFMPLMALRDHKGDLIVAGLAIPGEAHGKDMVAWTMAAICALHRATEVAFTSVAWMVTREGPDARLPDLPPSQCADRREIAMISMIDANGTGALHTASVIRENDLVGVGLWEKMEGHGDGPVEHIGRFADSIRHGMAMGKSMPPDLAHYVDEQIAAGRAERLVMMMVDKLRPADEQGGGVQN